MTEQKQMNSIPAMSGEGLKRLVLIVEDEFVNRELLNAYLEQDYEILCAETDVEAMRLIHEKSETLSLVLLDLNLPGKIGRAHV